MECYFHPGEGVIGICAFCLNERLLILASRQEQLRRVAYKRNPINLPNVFALTSLLNRLDLRHGKSDDHQYYSPESSGTQEDSFISIKFEDNGFASWEKHAKVSVEDEKAVIEHPMKASLRWRKRIGQLFQVIKYWKKPPIRKGNARHVGKKLERGTVRHGWMRALTKKRANKA